MCKATTRKSGSGGSNKKYMKAFIEALKSKILKDPTKSMRKMAIELKMNNKTMRRTS